MKLPSYSIIIPAINEADYIANTILALKKQTVPPKQIVIVDGGSDDQTVKLARQTGVMVIKARKGVGNQRNMGANKVKEPWLLFVDADTILPPNAAEIMLNHALINNAAAVIPWYWPKPGSAPITTSYFLLNIIFWLGQWRKPAGAGSCILVRKDVFSMVGGFPPWQLGEDLFLLHAIGANYTVRQAGVKVLCSDRRWRKIGFCQVWQQYLWLSWQYLLGNWERIRQTSYPALATKTK